MRAALFCYMKTLPALSQSLPSLIGWQGISLRAPEGWYLNGVHGTWREGVFQVASRGVCAVDVKWVRSQKASDLRFHLDRYLSKMEKDARKRKSGFSGKVEKHSDESLSFTWKADRKAVGIARRCPECRCIILAQVSGSRTDSVSTLASQIFSTLQDHSSDGWSTWCLYGLHTQVPEEFQLEKHRLLTGQTRLLFRHRREVLQIERIAQAEQLLNGNLPSQWGQFYREWRAYKGIWEERAYHRHQGAHFSGRLKMFPLVRECEQGLIRFQKPALKAHIAVWHCEPRNMLVHVVAQGGKKTQSLLEQVVERTQCH